MGSMREYAEHHSSDSQEHRHSRHVQTYQSRQAEVRELSMSREKNQTGTSIKGISEVQDRRKLKCTKQQRMSLDSAGYSFTLTHTPQRSERQWGWRMMQGRSLTGAGDGVGMKDSLLRQTKRGERIHLTPLALRQSRTQRIHLTPLSLSQTRTQRIHRTPLTLRQARTQRIHLTPLALSQARTQRIHLTPLSLPHEPRIK